MDDTGQYLSGFDISWERFHAFHYYFVRGKQHPEICEVQIEFIL